MSDRAASHGPTAPTSPGPAVAPDETAVAARVSAPVSSPPTGRNSPRTRRLQVALAVRLGVGIVLLGGTILVQGGAPSLAEPFFRLVLALFTTSLAFAMWLGFRPGHFEPVALALTATDFILTSVLVYLTGGAVSGFTSLYGVIVLAASVVVSPRLTLVAAGLAPILYVSVALGIASGSLSVPSASLVAPPPPSDTEFSLALLRNIVGLLLVGGLAATLSERMQRTTGALVRATENAAATARLTEDIVRSLDAGLLTTDLEGAIRTLNAAGARMLGATPDELVGRALARFFPEADVGAGARREGLARRLDESTFPVGYTQTPLVGHDGVVRGSLVLFQDLTELTTLRDKAERAERLAVLGQLAAGLAHEIRNPLGAISGSVELVREADTLSAEDRRLLGTVIGEVDRVNELVTTMLELGRPTRPERQHVDLAELANDVALLARRHPSAANVRLTVHSVPVEASVDPRQIRQVLWNLVKNAVQFSPKGGEVEVRVASDGAHARIEVLDHGPGIATTDRARVFEPFFTKRKHGVGLGLAIAKQIAEAHQGTLTLESEPGQTRFVLTLRIEGDGERRTPA